MEKGKYLSVYVRSGVTYLLTKNSQLTAHLTDASVIVETFPNHLGCICIGDN